MPTAKLSNWPLGQNNIAQPTRLPEGCVRSLVNMDATSGGELSLRAGFTKVCEAENLRGAFGLGRFVVLIEGDTAFSFDTYTQSKTELGAVAAGSVCATEFAGQLYLSTPTASYRTDGLSWKRWDVPVPAFSVEELPGGRLTGLFKVSVTALGEDGEESGAAVTLLRLTNAQLRVSSADTRPLRLYVSVADTATLYDQGELNGVAMLDQVNDQSARLVTDHLQSLPAVTQLASYHGIILGVLDSFVVLTDPLHPHLYDPVSGFFVFESPVQVLASTEGGVFVGLKDKTYFLSGLDTETPSQRLVLNMGAVLGSAQSLPDGTALWLTPQGQAIGLADGSVQMLHQERFVPELATQAATGLLDHNGNRLALTSLLTTTRPNPLAACTASDFAFLEC